MDTIIPTTSKVGYTCRQSSSLIGTESESGWYAKAKVHADGISSSAGLKGVWEGDAALSCGLGGYKGSTGMLRWQCSSKSKSFDVVVEKKPT